MWEENFNSFKNLNINLIKMHIGIAVLKFGNFLLSEASFYVESNILG